MGPRRAVAAARDRDHRRGRSRDRPGEHDPDVRPAGQAPLPQGRGRHDRGSAAGAHSRRQAGRAQGAGALRRGLGEPIRRCAAHGCWCRGRWWKAQPDYKPALENCFRLLGLARTFDRTGLITDSDFGPFALLLSALDGNAVPGFVHKTVGAIKAYDEKNGTALLETAVALHRLQLPLQAGRAGALDPCLDAALPRRPAEGIVRDRSRRCREPAGARARDPPAGDRRQARRRWRVAARSA